MTAQTPESPEAMALHARLSAARWAHVVAQAHVRAEIFDAVVAHQGQTKQGWRRSLAAVSPSTHWSSFVNWKRRFGQRSGPSWERLLDESRPPPPKPAIAEEIVRAALNLRRGDRSMTTDTARGHLVAVFAAPGKVSDAWLRRVWKASDLKYIAKPGASKSGQFAGDTDGPGAPNDVEEEVEYFSGGGGLAMLAAAEAELGCIMALAKSALQAGKDHSAKQILGANTDDDAAERGEHGKFTAEYNARRRGATPPGEADARWASDKAKAAQRPLATLQTLARQPGTLTAKMLAMGASPLLMESRGFDGLAGPAGAWLGALGGVAYMPATLDKSLTELGLLDVGPAMWRDHAQSWHKIARPWAGPETSWLRTAVYIDGTADPYWTQRFAKSGKVSRVGRVMPCLSRIAVNSGAGVPLLVESHVGAVSLKKRLLPMLAELDAAIGPEAGVGRLTVVDSEAGTAGMMWAMHGQTEAIFITVIKGQVLAGAHICNEGPWQTYRERDQLREVDFHIRGKDAPAEGLNFRGVQMHRDDSRHPHTTLFATNAHEDDLPAAKVADYYLLRWPRQEQIFRKARDGGGLNHSHGYGGGEVQHVALVSKLERAELSVAAAQKKLERANATRNELVKALADAPQQACKPAMALADKQVRDMEKQSTRRQAEQAELQTTPTQIYARDTGRDSIMTCLKLTVMALLEFVLKEYFGGVAMEWRTFITQLVPMPVTVRSSANRCVYQFHPNPRNPALMADVAVAVTAINLRGLRRGRQRLVFEVLPVAVRGP
jgi:hypothetical protein